MRQPIISPSKVFDADPEKNRPVAGLERQTRAAVQQLGAQKLDPFAVTGRVRDGIYRARPGDFVACEPGASDIHIHLPAPNPSIKGRQVAVKNCSSSTTPIRIRVSGDAALVEGAASLTLSSAFGAAIFACDGAAWWRLA